MINRYFGSPVLWGLALAGMLLFSACDDKGKSDGVDGIPMEEVHHGLRLDYMDTTVSPSENFFLYTNGGYLAVTEIPEEESRWGVFNELRDEADSRVRDILVESADMKDADPASLEYKIGTYYRTGMDSAAVDAAGLSAIQPELDLIAGIASKEDLMDVIGTFHKHSIYPAFVVWVDQDAKNSDRNILNLYQGGQGLPDRDYYLVEDEEKAALREKYVAFMAKTFELMGDAPELASAEADMVMRFETSLAEASLDRVSRRDPYKTYHLMDMAGLQELSPLPWARYFTAIGLSEPGEVNVAVPDFMVRLEKLSSDFSLDDWKNYLRLALVRSMAGSLSSDVVENSFDFYGRTLEGTPEMKPRWKRVTEQTNSALGMGIGKLYVDRHFSPRAKEIALDMVDNILAVMKDRLGNLEWMSPETRQEGVHKLNTILPKIGYPDEWRDYSEMEIKDQPFARNVLAARAFNFDYGLDKIGKPVDKKEWGMPPQTVNAYYNPSINEIVFPAGILQAPFFDEHVEAALNYGGFGAVIGHELIHAFDDQGSKFDAEGNLKDWWTEADLEAFKGRAKMVEEQYSEYVVLDSLHVNGKLTLGENIADIDGLRISYYAWKRSLDGKMPESKEGFTPEQRFFINYGQLWSSLMRPEAMRLMIATNPHSPAEWRVNGSTSSLTEFYEAFGVKEGDPMYREASERMSIW